MEDPSTAQHGSAHPPRQHHTAHHFNLTRLQSPRPGYTSGVCSKPPSDPLLGPPGSAPELPPQSPFRTAPWMEVGRDRAGHGVISWSGDDGGGAKEAWDGRGSCGSSASTFYGKEDFCPYVEMQRVIDDRDLFGLDAYRPSCDRSDGYDLDYASVYAKDANGAFPAGHQALYGRDAFRQPGADDGSPGDRSGEGRPSARHGIPDWRAGGGAADPPVAPSDGRPIQKLDSFSDAFRSYRRRGALAVADGDPAGRPERMEGARRGELAGWAGDGAPGCLYGPPPDSYVPPAHPFFSSLPSLPSPPHPSQLMPSVLSPPPTPLPPSSLSPPQGECPHPFVTAAGESVGPVQFFPSAHGAHPSPAGLLWKLPGVPRCYPQQPCHHRAVAEGNHTADPGDGADGPSEQCQSVLMSPESINSPITPSSFTPSFPMPSPLHSLFHPAHLPSFHQRKDVRITSCAPQAQEAQSRPPGQSYTKNGVPPTYRGTPFPSMLHRREDGQMRGHYTPKPILNPSRRGAGLYVSVASLSGGPQEMVRGGDVGQQDVEAPCINVGPAFQAELPTCSPKWEGSPCPAEEVSPWEQLLWKPFTMLGESVAMQDQVERLLSMCNSSCLPGGGANTELALHCLHFCNGDTMATLELLLLSLHVATADYHYSGSDVWTNQEKAVFSEGLRTLGKDFSSIQSMVKTKSVRQCVEFYYLEKRLLDVQHRQAERQSAADAAEAVEQQAALAPQPMRTLLGPERVVPASPLAAFFPCKMCGKMFYKIKSRNAHMKIHRQPPEDWSERRLQPQHLPHRLNAPHSLNPNLGGGSALLLPQASPRAFSFPGLPPSNRHSHPDGSLNSFEVNNDDNNGGVGVHASATRIKNGISTLAAFSNMSEMTPRGGVSESAANQREPPSVASPVQQQWNPWTG